MSRALCCIAALSAAGSWAAGAEPDRQNIIIDNVVVELSATPEGVTACVDAVHGTKLSGPYGVAITALSGPDAWQEKLPKTVAVEEDYFALPLRIELKRRAGATADGRLQFEVGACQPEGMCVPVELAVDIATLAPAAKQVPCKGRIRPQ
jgi:hypothetical protein